MSNICEHLQNDGVRCPHRAMYRRLFCYQHWRLHEHPVAASQPSYVLPVINDESALRLALTEVMRGVLSGKLETSQARFLVKALRLSADSFRRPSRSKNAVILNEDARPSKGPLQPSPHPGGPYLSYHKRDLKC